MIWFGCGIMEIVFIERGYYMVVMKLRIGDGLMEVVKEGCLIIVWVLFEGGGCFVVFVNDVEVKELYDVFVGVVVVV